MWPFFKNTSQYYDDFQKILKARKKDAAKSIQNPDRS